MINTTGNKGIRIRDLLLLILPIIAFISMQYRVDNTFLNIGLIITLFVLILMWLSSVNHFTLSDFIILTVNILSLILTTTFFSGTGVVLNFLNLLLALMIFNRVDFSEKAITLTRIILIIGIAFFFVTSTYSLEWNWVYFYDKDGILINNNTVAFILVALYIHLSSFLLKNNRKWCYIIVGILFALCTMMVNVLGCRSALLFFIAYVILSLFKKIFVNDNKLIRKICIIFLLVSVSLPIFYIFLYTKIGNFEIMGKSFFSGRELVWLEAYKQIKISPVIGSGTQFILEYGKNATDSTHNMLLGMWKNVGIIPMVSTIFYYTSQKRPKTESNIVISFIAIIIIACFESFLMDSRLYLLFLLAFLGTENKNCKTKNDL